METSKEVKTGKGFVTPKRRKVGTSRRDQGGKYDRETFGV